jgi:hypothetical protein
MNNFKLRTMKNKGYITVLLLIILMAASSMDLFAQGRRGMRGSVSDDAIMNQRRDSMRIQMAGRRMAMMHNDSLNRGTRQFYGRMPHMSPYMMGRGYGRMTPDMAMPGMRNRRMNENIGPMGMRQQFYGNRNGMRGFAYGNGRGAMMQNAPGRRIMESIPGITTKQQQELNNLIENQQAEAQKLRENHQEALKTLRDDHRKKVMDLLTNDQKKWLEENTRVDNR